ncbi:hypothetical protein HBF26_13230 [Luteibacter jiangsuensis]|uniref:Uncharacterized protein n=1 Tax=Luteibacter jiangsuensis TaxID=637577 RepID=A0ABX0Q640_9GAMM|nr:hypothetical protein [Luteibacter jiangsuensis]NID05857.1 hypothetical protein [Luteibacter jiangsuensis]
MSRSADLRPTLHDGFLDGFLSRGAEIRVFARTDKKVPVTLILSGVKRFSVNGFAEGNIILDCAILSSDDISEDILVLLNHGEDRERYLAPLRAIVSDQSHQVLMITPSYGATLVALHEQLAVVEGTIMD